MTTGRTRTLTGNTAATAISLGLGERSEAKRRNHGGTYSRWLFSDEEVAIVTAEIERRRDMRPSNPSRTIRLGKGRASHITAAKTLGLGEMVRRGKRTAFFVSPDEDRALLDAIRTRKREADRLIKKRHRVNKAAGAEVIKPSTVGTPTATVRNAERRAIESFREELAAGRERRDAWRYACGWTGYEGPMPMVDVEPVDRSALIAEAAQRRDGDHRESRRVMAPTGTVRAA